MKLAAALCLFLSINTFAQNDTRDRTSDAVNLSTSLKDYSNPNLLHQERTYLDESAATLDQCCSQNDSNYYSVTQMLENQKAKLQTQLQQKKDERAAFLKLSKDIHAFRDAPHTEQTARFRAWLKADTAHKDVKADIFYKLLPAQEKKVINSYVDMEVRYANTVNSQDQLLVDTKSLEKQLSDTNDKLNGSMSLVAVKNQEIDQISTRFNQIKSNLEKEQIDLSNVDFGSSIPCASRTFSNMEGFDNNTILVKGVRRDMMGTPYNDYAILRLKKGQTPNYEFLFKCKYFPCETDPTPPTFGNLESAACQLNAACSPLMTELFGGTKPLVDFNTLGNFYLPQMNNDSLKQSKDRITGTGEYSYFDLYVKLSHETFLEKYKSPENYAQMNPVFDAYFQQVQAGIDALKLDPKASFQTNNIKILNAVKKIQADFKKSDAYTSSTVDPSAKNYILDGLNIDTWNRLNVADYDDRNHKTKANQSQLRQEVLTRLDRDCATTQSTDPLAQICPKYSDFKAKRAALAKPRNRFTNEVTEKDDKGCPKGFVFRFDQGYFNASNDPAACTPDATNGLPSSIKDIDGVLKKQ